MKSIIRNKKGELSDMFIFVITIFILAIGLFIFIYIIPSITNGMNISGMNNSAEGRSAISALDKIGTSTINNGFMLLFVGLIMSMMITSFLVRTHPIFLFLYIFFLAVSILLSVYLGNVYYDIQNSALFSGVVNNASYINVVMNHIVEITLAVGALSMIIVFAKFSTYGGQSNF
jgi:hypothetical protein